MMARQKRALRARCGAQYRLPGRSYCRECWREFARRQYAKKKGFSGNAKKWKYWLAWSKKNKIREIVKKLKG